MCTHPLPNRRSVSASARALGAALFASVHAAIFLAVALLGWPVRCLWSARGRQRPPSLAHVDVQVLLGDASCVAELEDVLWQTLDRAAQLWAPLSLPVDRVVVGAGFPATGKADIYDDFLALDGQQQPGLASVSRDRRVVISLGLRDGARDLDGWEVAGALAAQIQAVIDERYRQLKRLAASAPSEPSHANLATARLTARPASPEPSGIAMAPTPELEARIEAANNSSVSARMDTPTLTELLATVQQGQPLVAAGPSPNGTHP
jgi:hypothetical protein